MVLSNLSLSISYTHRSYLLNQMVEEGSDPEQGIYSSPPPQDREHYKRAEEANKSDRLWAWSVSMLSDLGVCTVASGAWKHSHTHSSGPPLPLLSTGPTPTATEFFMSATAEVNSLKCSSGQ